VRTLGRRKVGNGCVNGGEEGSLAEKQDLGEERWYVMLQDPHKVSQPGLVTMDV